MRRSASLSSRSVRRTPLKSGKATAQPKRRASWSCSTQPPSRAPVSAQKSSVVWASIAPASASGLWSVKTIMATDAPSGVALVQQAEPVERQQVVDLVDGLGEGHDMPGEAARGDRLGLLPHLGAQPRDDRVDLAREPVDDPRADRVDRRLADERPRRPEVDARQLGGAAGECVERDLHARGDDAAEV